MTSALFLAGDDFPQQGNGLTQQIIINTEHLKSVDQRVSDLEKELRRHESMEMHPGTATAIARLETKIELFTQKLDELLVLIRIIVVMACSTVVSILGFLLTRMIKSFRVRSVVGSED